MLGLCWRVVTPAGAQSRHGSIRSRPSPVGVRAIAGGIVPRTTLGCGVRFGSVHPAFVEVDVVEEGLDVGAVAETTFRETLLETLREVVIPTAFTHVLVPDRDPFLVRFSAVLKAPSEQFFVRLVWMGAHVFGESVVGHSEEAHTAEVEPSAEICDVVLGQASSGMETDFVDHPSEIDDAAGFIVRTAEAGHVHVQRPLTSQPLR